MRALSRMAAQTRNKRQAKVEFVHEPLDICTTVLAQHLDISGLLATPFSVSVVKRSTESSMPFCLCVRAFATLMPLVALVELQPQNEDLSNNVARPLFSRMSLQTDTPENRRRPRWPWCRPQPSP